MFIQPVMSSAELQIVHPQLVMIYNSIRNGTHAVPDDGADVQSQIIAKRAQFYRHGRMIRAEEGWLLMAATAQTVLEDAGEDPRGCIELQPLMLQLHQVCKHSLARANPVTWDSFESRHIEPSMALAKGINDSQLKPIACKMVEAVAKESRRFSWT